MCVSELSGLSCLRKACGEENRAVDKWLKDVDNLLITLERNVENRLKKLVKQLCNKN